MFLGIKQLLLGFISFIERKGILSLGNIKSGTGVGSRVHKGEFSFFGDCGIGLFGVFNIVQQDDNSFSTVGNIIRSSFQESLFLSDG